MATEWLGRNLEAAGSFAMRYVLLFTIVAVYLWACVFNRFDHLH